MEILRTPDERFTGLPGYSFAPNYVEVEGLRIHYLDEGPKHSAPVLLMHGEPSWCYLYRKMAPILSAAGHRVLAPDLVGFGRSDKPASQSDYSYESHVRWIAGWLKALDLKEVTLVGQDWGSLIGLRLVAEHGERFARVVIANGGLPTGEGKVPEAFRTWQQFAITTPVLPVGRIVSQGCVTQIAAEVQAAYDAPFPTELYKAGARAFPKLVPTEASDPAAPANRAAWEKLRAWKKPFLTASSDSDPITKGNDLHFQREVPGAQGQPHVTIQGAGHFLQEDKGEELAEVVLSWLLAPSF
ncbi:MAG TPA: haloalkane dehalogenase [Candidatus Solibacter sp.]|jgi:haloalkane dehalogenase|nr:haloalkane dehalogenase [Candidatus Solibacter sp.]